jgi:glycosyltransferase involved in cell wall biosynthesis
LNVLPLDLSQVPNGAAIRGLEIARRLAVENESVLVSATPDRHVAPELAAFSARVEVARLRHGSVGVLRRTLAGRAFDGARFSYRMEPWSLEPGFDVGYVHLTASWDLWRVMAPAVDCRTVVFDLHNDDNQIWRDRAIAERNPMVRRLARLYAKRAAVRIREICASSSAVVCVSDEDKASISRLVGEGLQERIHVVPNGVDTSSLAPPPDVERNYLTFVGSLDVRMNQLAVDLLIADYWPLIRAAVPDIKLAIVGRDPPGRLGHGLPSDIELAASPPDVRPYLWRSLALIAPFTSGGGTKIKILEAMASGVVVVATDAAVRGLPLESGKHFLRVDSPPEAARAVRSLYNSRELTERLRMNARELVQQFDWRRIAGDVERLLADTTKTA